MSYTIQEQLAIAKEQFFIELGFLPDGEKLKILEAATNLAHKAYTVNLVKQIKPQASHDTANV